MTRGGLAVVGGGGWVDISGLRVNSCVGRWVKLTLVGVHWWVVIENGLILG